MSSLKTNVVLNFVNTLTGIVFPVITFPYAARVLLPEGIGTFNFLQSIVTYIVLLTSLGIPMYAVREVARYRDDIQRRNKVSVEIILLSTWLSIGGYVIIWALGEFVPQIHSQLALFYVLSLTIFFTNIGVNWFYQAVEDFKYITVRALCFRVLAAVSLFLFVKSADDLIIYAFVVVGSTVGNNFINFIHLRKYIPWSQIDWHSLSIWRHLKPSLRIFVFNLVTSIYLNLNTVMLGFMQGDTAVGLYTAGNKLSHIILNVVASLGVVMLPRCSNLIETGKWGEFAAITRKSYRFVWAFSLPAMIGLILLAEPIMVVFCGTEFKAATVVLYWTAPIILFIGLSNVIGLQILYPQGKEQLVILSVFGGALVNVLFNILLVPSLSYVGAAIATFIAEFIVLIIQIVWGKKSLPFLIFEKKYLNYLAASIIMSLGMLVIVAFIHDYFIQIMLSFSVGSILYLVVLKKLGDALLNDIFIYIRCKCDVLLKRF